jgi:hypothetical protein
MLEVFCIFSKPNLIFFFRLQFILSVGGCKGILTKPFIFYLFLRLHFSLPGRCCMCSPGWTPACTCPSCWEQKSHRAAQFWRDRQACPSHPSSQPGTNGKIKRDIQTWICG